MSSNIIGIHYHTCNDQMQSLYETLKNSKIDDNLIHDRHLIQKTT